MRKIDSKHGDRIRKSYQKSFFPSLFVTWLTGKSLSGKKPIMNNRWYYYFTFVASVFIFSLWLGFYNQMESKNPALMVLSWAGLLFSSRRMAAVILHQSVHGRLSNNKKTDMLIGELVTILMITQDFKTYQQDHCNIHHAPSTFATSNDPIVVFFTKFGIQPGLTKSKLYLNLFATILSPIFHIQFMIARLRYNININRILRSTISVAYISLLLSISYFIGSLESFFMIFIIPIVIFYQISAFIEICSEHAWFDNIPKTRLEREMDPYYYADISWGRFCGSEYPDENSPKIFLWYISNLLFHLPVRLFILVGDLPQHDYHHRKPLCLDWLNVNYNRQNSITCLDEGEPKYMEIWGLQNAVNHVFTIMASKSRSELLTP